MEVALCFLSMQDVQQREAWSSWLAHAAPGSFSVYLHRADGEPSSRLPDCQVVPAVPTQWGDFSLLRAQRRLFTAALERSPAVVALLSGDCAPCLEPRAVHAELLRGSLACHTSTAVQEKREKTCDRSAWPWPWTWTAHTQWTALFLEDVRLLQMHWQELEAAFGASEVPDEHAYGTLLAGLGRLERYPQKPFMEVSWSDSLPCPHGLFHRLRPCTFHVNDAPHLLLRLQTKRVCFLRKLCPAERWPAVVDAMELDDE